MLVMWFEETSMNVTKLTTIVLMMMMVVVVVEVMVITLTVGIFNTVKPHNNIPISCNNGSSSSYTTPYDNKSGLPGNRV